MKKLMLIFFILHNIVYCQDINHLEEKAGWKDFKIGNNIQFYYNDVVKHSTIKNYYKYVGVCCNEFLGAKVGSIELITDNDGKITSIFIRLHKIRDFCNTEKSISKQVMYKLLDLFGKPTKSSYSETSGAFELTWYAPTITLAFIEEEVRASGTPSNYCDWGYYNGLVMIFKSDEKKYIEELKKEF